jgi:hypothetical protein
VRQKRSSHLLSGNFVSFVKFFTGINLYNFLKPALTVSVFSLLVSGCVLAPDTVTVSSISTESRHPAMLPDKKTMKVPEKVSVSLLPVRVTSRGFLGRAPYICTPSGFGRTSGCFLRKG